MSWGKFYFSCLFHFNKCLKFEICYNLEHKDLFGSPIFKCVDDNPSNLKSCVWKTEDYTPSPPLPIIIVLSNIIDQNNDFMQLPPKCTIIILSQ